MSDVKSHFIRSLLFEKACDIYGHSNFYIGNDVVSQIIYGNYTLKSEKKNIPNNDDVEGDIQSLQEQVIKLKIVDN